MESMKWSEQNASPKDGSAGAPTIKNHSVTHFNGYLYCFGGYDGRRNHLTLLLYSIREKRWIRPHHNHSTTTTTSTNNNNNSVGGGIGNNIGGIGNIVLGNNNNNNNDIVVGNHHHLLPPGAASASVSGGVIPNVVPPPQPPPPLPPPQQPHHFLGDTTSVIVNGTPPPGRNGHSATLATDPDDEDSGRIIIIGGWLGTGPLAASDMHVLDISNGGRQLRWFQPAVKGTPPGPCNMHSADFVASRREVYVFRGGNGREYLNDLHALNTETLCWRKVETTGAIPQQRANHSSAILEETGELFVFGGWNGTERLNDIHILDTATSTWTRPHAGGVLPHPRAGMTLTALRGRLYLFGGSGTSSKCFQDLQILDRSTMSWLDVTQYESSSMGHHHGGVVGVGGGRHNGNNMNLLHHHRGGGGGYGDDIIGLGGGHHIPPHHHLHNDNHHHHHVIESEHDYHHQPAWKFGGYGGGVDGPYNDAPHHMDPTAMSMEAGGMMNQGVGIQDGSSQQHGSMFVESRRDWKSREMGMSAATAARPRQGAVNPNDEDTVPTVIVHGRGPGRRAGHTATAVNRKIYVFGGSCGSDYLNDFYVLDTDPPPNATVTEPTSLRLIERRLRHFFNDEEFSDVTFLVQGRKVYGHKMVLSIVSDCFRAMFTSGFRETDSMEITIPDCSYDSFLSLMHYIYTGAPPTIDHHSMAAANGDVSAANVTKVVEILELADRFFLDNLKQICETLLQPLVSEDTVEYLLQVAQKTNSMQLQAICEHFIRNRDIQQQQQLQI